MDFVEYYSFKNMERTEFAPYAYSLIDNTDDWDHLRHFNCYPKEEIDMLEDSLDFNECTYLIVAGAKIKNIYWSFKTTLFDDHSPPYSKAYHEGKKCIIIDYSAPDGKTYIYKLRKYSSFKKDGG